MAKQDDYTRLSIRVPKRLYEMLVDAAGEHSLNAEIIYRLRSAFPHEPEFEMDTPGREFLGLWSRLRSYEMRIREARKAQDEVVERMNVLMASGDPEVQALRMSVPGESSGDPEERKRHREVIDKALGETPFDAERRKKPKKR